MASEHLLVSPIACQFYCSSKIIVNLTPIWPSGNRKSLKLAISIATMTSVTNGQETEEIVEIGPDLYSFPSCWQK